MKRWRPGLALLILILLILLLAGGGCSNRSVTNPYDYSNFTRLDIQNAFDVEIIQSGTYGVTVTSSEALLDYLSIRQEGETLIIKLHPNHPFTDFITMRKELKAKITMPVLRSITISGACKGVVRGFESTNNLDVDVSGASTLTLNGIETGDAVFAVSGESKITGKLTAVDLDLNISGASLVDLKGSGEDIVLKASGASKIKLEEFTSQTADITLSGACETTTDTRQHLDVSLTGASRFFFLSNPSFGKTEVMGASTIKHK
jgi:hypothetical protein